MTLLVLLIDCHYVLCNRYALWSSPRDHADWERFHAIQSIVEQRWLRAHGLPFGAGTDTVYLIHGWEVLKKSIASFALVAELAGRVHSLRLLQWTRALGADVVYDFLTRTRYRWVGSQAEACSLMHAAQLCYRTPCARR